MIDVFFTALSNVWLFIVAFMLVAGLFLSALALMYFVMSRYD